MAEATFAHLRGVVLDWAGTTVDFGSCAPAIVFQEIFRRREVPITAAEAREPMGMAKREHIAAIAKMPRVAEAWRTRYAAECGDVEIDAMYAEFLPLQQSILQEHSQLIPGVAELSQWLREHGLKIGSSTGYTRELMTIVATAAAEQGYQPDCTLCADDAPRGRPAPYLLFEAAKRLDIYPMMRIVKVDDTPVGIQAGRNAGCWTIGISLTGNCVGLTETEWDSLPESDRQTRLTAAEEKLFSAGADVVVPSVADIRPALVDFERRLAEGDSPRPPLEND